MIIHGISEMSDYGQREELPHLTNNNFQVQYLFNLV